MVRPLPSLEEAFAILARRRSRPARGAPPAAGRALRPSIKALEARFGQGAEGLRAHWPAVVGEALATRTEPVRLSRNRTAGGGALEIRVEGAAATLIQHQAPEILARVALVLGPGVVERLRIVQGPVRARRAATAVAPTTRQPPLDLPLDAAAEQALARDLAGVGDDRLRVALLRLGRAVTRRERR